MAYSVPPLPYAYDALEPHIDKATMEFHHDKHHQAYVDKANAALEGTEWADKPVEEVLRNLGSLPSEKQAPVRNNGGGHYNHTMFWENMSPGGGGEPRLKRLPATGEDAATVSSSSGCEAGSCIERSTWAAASSFSAAAASRAAIRSGVIAVSSSFSASHRRASAA